MAALSLVPVAQAATTQVIFADGTGNSTPMNIVEGLLPPGFDYTIQKLDYPAAIRPFTGKNSPTGGQSLVIGFDALDSLLHTMSGPVTVVGGSLGAMVIDQELVKLASSPTPPTQPNFVIVGDPGRPGGVLSLLPMGARVAGIQLGPSPLAETPYQVQVVVQQYDGLANFPDRPWNLLAVLNALVGTFYYHNVAHYAEAVQEAESGLVPESNITIEHNDLGGVTTTYFVERPLALTAIFAKWAPNLAANLNRLLTPIVNRGYSSLTPDAGPHIEYGRLVRETDSPAPSGTPAVEPTTATRFGATRTTISRTTVPKTTAATGLRNAAGASGRSDADADAAPTGKPRAAALSAEGNARTPKGVSDINSHRRVEHPAAAAPAA